MLIFGYQYKAGNIMGLFATLLSLIFKDEEIDYSEIKSVMVIDITQLYTTKYNYGYSSGWKWGDGRSIMMPSEVPDGGQYTFSVTFKDGSKKIIKARSDTEKCNRLLQFVYDPPGKEKSSTSQLQIEDKENKNHYPVLGKNQLPNGIYVIGKDIPPGTYDFKCIWGDCYLVKIGKGETDWNCTNYYECIGADSETRVCLNVTCEEGEKIKVDGNAILEISKSKPVEIDL
jgi:hypothetical protein